MCPELRWQSEPRPPDDEFTNEKSYRAGDLAFWDAVLRGEIDGEMAEDARPCCVCRASCGAESVKVDSPGVDMWFCSARCR